MACAGRASVWWDRDFDNTGRPIRLDVRSAGQEVWAQAFRQTIALIGDHGPAAELMENAVAQVSRYLDRIGAPEASRKHGLVMTAFSRSLRRFANRANRLELVGGSVDLSDRAVYDGWVDHTNMALELERLVRRLGERNGLVLMLRAAGFEWKEIAAIFETSVNIVRNGFWREIKKLRVHSSEHSAS